MYRSLVIAAVLIVSACAKPEDITSNAIADRSDDTIEPDGAAEPANPTPNYQDREGDRYLYVAAVSEEDEKKGKAAGDVIQYRFLGERNGMLELDEIAESGVPIGRLECRRACQIMKFTSDGQVSRIPYGNSSIASAAMADAINGFLDVTKASPAPVMARRIPAAFVGKWNPEPSDCGIGENAGAVFVAADKLTFYESGLDVAGVEIINPSRAKVTGRLTDEEGAVSTMTYTLSLQAGKLLVDDNMPRTRCSD